MIATANFANIGAQVIRATNGKEAVSAAFARPRPDFILMDCRMPVMDGPTASREIRAIESKIGLRNIPIVALTASPSDEDRRECYQAGMDGLLMKPFTLGATPADHRLVCCRRSVQSQPPALRVRQVTR